MSEETGSHAGRPSSWLAVTVCFIGFVISGIAMVIGPSWPLFWVGAAVAVLGGVLGLAVGLFNDVVVDEPREISSYAADSVLGQGMVPATTDQADHPTRTDPEQLPHG